MKSWDYLPGKISSFVNLTVREQVAKSFVPVFQNNKSMSRFFFALFPDKSAIEAIVKYREQINLSGRIIKASNLHLTLLFLGKLNVNQLQKVIRQSEHINCVEFDLLLNSIGYFKNSKITWLGLEFIPDSLLELHKQLLSAVMLSSVKSCELSVHTQKYKPHVTLARKSAAVEKRLIVPVKWHVKEFVLVESIDTPEGVHYQPVEYFSCDFSCV